MVGLLGRATRVRCGALEAAGGAKVPGLACAKISRIFSLTWLAPASSLAKKVDFPKKLCPGDTPAGMWWAYAAGGRPCAGPP